MKFSVIIAIYNRKEELNELLNSLAKQTFKDFEVLVIDDGSQVELKSTIDNYKEDLDISYYKKQNSGPGLTRNYGSEKAKNEYLIFLDSDCIVPEKYLENVNEELTNRYTDAFGGPDSAHKDFNDLQKAISYSMTSIFTTGGIRGGKKQVGKFQPRSFNMGISKHVFLNVGGFSEMRIGEDPDLSMTLWENGFSTRLFSDAKVYHKRRTSVKKFAKQVYEFGIARPILNQRHSQYKKITFWFPSLFLIYSVFSALLLCFSTHFLFWIPFLFLFFYFFVLFVHSTYLNESLKIGFLSVIASAVQLYSYGYGFLKSFVKLNILKLNPKTAFPKHFYSESV
ncbi:MAG: glycosyltransferase [Flavobacteriales bacterium]|nr:glycosyltransferase [Flavobacteriales bacterium]